MRWYAETPARRTRQVVADLLVVAWTLVWVLLGRWLHDVVGALAAPADPLRSAGSSLQARMDEVAATVTEVPLVGAQLSTPFAGTAAVGTDLVSAGDSLQRTVGQTALVTSLLVVLPPIVLVLLVWLVLRTRYAVRAGVLARERDRPELAELLALRALVHQPAGALARVADDPLGAWRRGDPGVVAGLVELELRGSGLRGPLRSGAPAARR